MQIEVQRQMVPDFRVQCSIFCALYGKELKYTRFYVSSSVVEHWYLDHTHLLLLVAVICCHFRKFCQFGASVLPVGKKK